MTDSPAPATPFAREHICLAEPGHTTLSLQVQRPRSASTAGDVIYVHGATFGADLSIFYRFDGHSWADEMNDQGWVVWGFDFTGYGGSDRYPQDIDRPAGRMSDVVPQLRRVLAAVRARNGGRPVALVAHSWGGSVAAHYAGCYPQDVQALVLFAPVVARTPPAPPATEAPQAPQPSHYPLTLWAQYRRFIEDVPRGCLQVLGEAHFQAWGAAYLATDPNAATHMPPAVTTPSGPRVDILALWSGQALYEPARIVAPTLLVRGAWDSVCNDADANRLLSELGSADKADCKIDDATHLMHLESQRHRLYDCVNAFLKRTALA